MKTHHSSFIIHNSSLPPRGVLLLVVLAILALFALIAVAFVVISGQAQRSAKSIERFEQVIDPPEKLLHQAAMQVFRGPTTNLAGTPDPASVMGAHSLLEDIYGDEPLWIGPHPSSGAPTSSRSCVITGVGPACGGQLVEFTYRLLVPDPLAPLAPATPIPDPLIARRLGCVITFIQSPNPGVVGQSTRLVGFNPSDTSRGHMLALGSGTPAVGDEFTINGVPFSGTGFGYNATNHTLDATDLTITLPSGTNPSLALLPNNRNANSNPLGGANEDYDAADFQNMLLAAQVPNATAPGGIQTLPSLHRPALVRYWAQRTNPSANFTTSDDLDATAAAMPPDLKRATILRPLVEAHLDFTGSNPGQRAFNPLWDGRFIDTNVDGICDYAWDVDNDGDGATDSVWVDLGMPVRATTDGRLYKPLFAILCVDLDGRLNLNAHGSIPQANVAYYGQVSSAPGLLAGGLNLISLPRGLGFGPAEINLNSLLGDLTIYGQLMTGISGGYQGRYGSTGVPGAAGLLDPLSANKWFEYAGEQNSTSQYWWGFQIRDENNYVRDSFGSPPDPFGTGGVGLDLAGRPLYLGGMGNTIVDNPYEMNLDANQSRGLPSGTPDNPFSLAELERLLRPFDHDAPSLPDRLAVLTSITGSPIGSVLLDPAYPARRKAFTTESWDLPCPAVPLEWRVAERLKKRLTDGGLTVPQALALLPRLLPTELLAGLRMNINRPLGNGRAYSVNPGDDTDNPGIVDAPPAVTPTAPAKEVQLADSPTTTVSVPITYDGAGALAGNPLQARQLMARHLYVLVLTLADRPSLRSHFSGNAEDAARAVAQWAVNVVDFRDRDNIMTPFDYDPSYATDNPVTGWNPQPRNPMYRVWGCERPELLITETTAFHDRKTEDLGNEEHDPDEPDDSSTAAGRTTDAVPNKDASFDQKSKPEGSLFIELYNPAGPFEPPVNASDANPPHLFGTDMSGTRHYLSCVRLNQTTPPQYSGDTKFYPVWRLAITADADVEKDLNDPHSADWPDVERSVYFVDPTTTITGIIHGEKYHTTSDIAPILPGRYAVIGPNIKTLVGTRTDNNPDETRRIELVADDDPNDSWNQVSVLNNRNPASSTNELSTGATGSIKPPVAVVINQPRRLSVSEPTDDTYNEGFNAGFYDPIKDKPIDENRGDEALQKNGTTPNYRIVHLQRLANPRRPWKGLYMDGTMPADYNPYITIDSQPIDLTVFNGLDSSEDPKNDKGDTVMFASRQRGEENPETDGVNNLWRRRLDPKGLAATPIPDPPVPTDLHVFKYILQHTLGYLNTSFGTPYQDPIDPTNAATGWRSYRGDPDPTSVPFPWLTWNNRPYVSQLELMLVPWVRSSQLLRYYNTAQPGDPYTTVNVPFPHLLNLFPSNSPSGTPNEELHRVLEYLHVPSPFAGTGAWANPTAAAGAAGHTFHPPFCRISAYREPGRINLNTIYSEAVFQGLMNEFLGLSWADFVQSRRNNDGATNVLDPPAATCPTEFARPFRSFGGASMEQPITSLQLGLEIEGTLLRPDSTGNRPLFHYDTTNQIVNTDRNPYFHYQGLQRLGNLVTTRSNVYAVWITVGYFEVTAVAPDPVIHPDGYTLGRELGMDTGEIERHRAFYIFDRSIPVGFQRGKDLNVEKAILVDRFIE